MRIAATTALLVAFTFCAYAQQQSDLEVIEIVAQSQRALDTHDNAQALRLLQDGLRRFPDDQDLQLQLSRVYVYRKQDHEAMAILESILQKEPANRKAKLALAQIYGYRSNFQKSDALYREVLAARPGDEPAELGLVRNLVVEGKTSAAKEELQTAIQRNPTSLGLQQYNEYISSSAASGNEGRPEYYRSIQDSQSYFSDSSGNHALYSSQSLPYEINRRLFTRFRMDESSLWIAAAAARNVISGTEEARYRINKYAGVRASAGAVRFNDTSSKALFGGDLEIFPFKNAVVSGGYSQFAVAPTFESIPFDLLWQGWHTHIGYDTRNLTVNVNASFGRYTDSNHVERESGEAMRWFGTRRISIGGGYAFRHLHFTQPFDHGYFDPGQYRSHLGASGIRLALGKVYRLEALGYLGAEKINQGNYTTAGEFQIRNQFFVRRWQFEGGYSHYQLVQNTAAFRADMVSGSVGYRF
jgi:tetratricopeptide (TPR) repeat protein